MDYAAQEEHPHGAGQDQRAPHGKTAGFGPAPVHFGGGDLFLRQPRSVSPVRSGSFGAPAGNLPKTPLNVVSAAVYGGTMVLLYTISTLYHSLGLNKAKVVFRSLDHCTIFLLIAGTYTPITLVCLGGWKGWTMFGVVWAAGVVGVVLNAISVERFKKISMACYLAMGWVVVLAMGDFYRAASPLTFWCLLGGGILYTVGAALYGVGKRVPYMHSVFHLFVLGGSVLHTISVWAILQ